MRRFYLLIFIVFGFIVRSNGQSFNLDPTSLNFGNVCVNTTSAYQSFTISGTSLTSGTITIGPLAGFGFSKNSTGSYTPNITFDASDLTTAQTVYVEFTPTTASNYSCSIPIAGAGGSSSVAVTALGQANNPVSVAINASQTTICTGDQVTFTPTTKGTNLTYQWRINGVNSGPTTSTFQTSSLTVG